MQDRVALITGGNSGIGRAVAIALAREGAHVAISYLAEEEAAALETCGWIEAAGRTALRLPGDIRDEAHCVRMVERVAGELGRLDVLVNNAGFAISYARLEEFDTADLTRVYHTNVYPIFWLCRSALARMRSGGAIVNTASMQALDPSPNLLAYAGTKAAVVNFTKGLAKVAIRQGVRVNAVAPGPVWTPLVRATLSPEQLRVFGRDTSFNRAAQPAEIAPVFVFLASDDARYVNGEIYGVSGGSRI